MVTHFLGVVLLALMVSGCAHDTDRRRRRNPSSRPSAPTRTRRPPGRSSRRLAWESTSGRPLRASRTGCSADRSNQAPPIARARPRDEISMTWGTPMSRSYDRFRSRLAICGVVFAALSAHPVLAQQATPTRARQRSTPVANGVDSRRHAHPTRGPARAADSTAGIGRG